MIKVADFGLSESMDVTKEYFRQNKDTAIKLPVKWMAIESITDGIFSEKTDVVRMNCLIAFSHSHAPPVGLRCDVLGNFYGWEDPLPRNSSSGTSKPTGNRTQDGKTCKWCLHPRNVSINWPASHVIMSKQLILFLQWNNNF